jgi:hypothetical protein
MTVRDADGTQSLPLRHIRDFPQCESEKGVSAENRHPNGEDCTIMLRYFPLKT